MSRKNANIVDKSTELSLLVQRGLDSDNGVANELACSTAMCMAAIELLLQEIGEEQKLPELAKSIYQDTQQLIREMFGTTH